MPPKKRKTEKDEILPKKCKIEEDETLPKKCKIEKDETSVWIVVRSKQYQRGKVEAVFSSYEKAKKHVESNMLNSSWGKYKQTFEGVWENECSYIDITKYVVDKVR